MSDLSVEALKQVDLVSFLAGQYGLEFRRQGDAYACCSPFTGERTPSFFVRLVNGRVLSASLRNSQILGASGGDHAENARFKARMPVAISAI